MTNLIFIILNFGLAFSFVAMSDWAEWRGPARNGVSNEKNLPVKWSPAGENLAWRAPYGGRSAPIVMGDRVYIQNAAGKGETLQERVMCFNADTGKLLWEHRFNIYLSDVPPHRVGWASPAGDPATGNVYVFGVGGNLTGLNRDGKVLWERSLGEDFGLLTTHGGRTVSPIIDGDLVIVSGVTFQCLRVDAGTDLTGLWATAPTCLSPKSYFDLAPGNHEFWVRATDSASSFDTKMYAWTVGPPPVASQVACGQILTQSTRLTNDLVDCGGHGLIVGAPGITIDLDGHVVDGLGLDAGILNNGHDDVTITNGLVTQFLYGVQLNPGTARNVVHDLRLEVNEEAGIALSDADERPIFALDGSGVHDIGSVRKMGMRKGFYVG